mgnify:CR=1 FL=1
MSVETATKSIALIKRVLSQSGGPTGPFMPAGLGTRSAPPPPGVEPLTLTALSGVEDLDRDELVLTALAGTPVDRVAQEAAAVGLVLCPLIPLGTGGTLGGLYASGSESPCAPVEGHLRDAVLGVEGLTGSGAPIKSGGRVVKNVTGYDLTRFLCGSRGALAVITRLHWRLRLLPTDSIEVVIDCPATDVGARLRALRALPDPTAVRIDLNAGRTRVRALIEGGRPSASARAEQLKRGLGPGAEILSVPDEQLAPWLAPPAGTREHASVRGWIERIEELGTQSDGVATVFPYIGVGTTSAPPASAPLDAIPFGGEITRRVRSAWDPEGRLWDPHRPVPREVLS